jgi:tRNA/tmRNA/rRNA uracil-C5-methylase (TrmA/RlmC/RlmD family)
MAETVSLTIQDVAFGGKGVGRAGGKAVFVPFTMEGEEVTARVVKQKKTWAEAHLVSMEQTSPHRVEPPCPYFGACGGCSYQHISYEHQLEIKSRQVEQTLRRVGRLENVPMRAIIPSPKSYAYRNRIRVHVENGVVGFYRFDRHELLDIEQCPISAPGVNAALRELRQQVVRDGDYTLTERGRGEFFTQTNEDVSALLLDCVRGLVRHDHETLVDAYCGAGFFAKNLAPFFPRVIGIEANPFAIEQARRSAKPNETYYAGDVIEHLGAILSELDQANTTLILDPPALGVEPRVLDFILFSKPNEVIYVSCNPATLARDLAALCRIYQLQSVTPLDMFPQTAEIETVAHLRS